MLANVSFASAPVVSSNKSTFCQGDFTAKLSLYSLDQAFFYYWQKQLPDLSWQDISSQQYIAIGATDLYSPDLSNTLNYRVRYSLDISMSTESFSNSYMVTVNPLPTITTTGILSSLCFSTSLQSATLSYSASTYTPTSYTVDWNAASNYSRFASN
jgi:hypothetical protein